MRLKTVKHCRNHQMIIMINHTISASDNIQYFPNVHVQPIQPAPNLTNPSLEQPAPLTPSRPSDKRLSLAEPPNLQVPRQASCSRSCLSNPSQCNSIHPFTFSPSPPPPLLDLSSQYQTNRKQRGRIRFLIFSAPIQLTSPGELATPPCRLKTPKPSCPSALEEPSHCISQCPFSKLASASLTSPTYHGKGNLDCQEAKKFHIVFP